MPALSLWGGGGVRVAAIDSATTSGWAVVERIGGAREAVVGHGRWRFRGRTAAEVAAAVDQLVAYQPDVVALESPYVGSNADTALVLAELLGRFRQEVERRGLPTVTTKAAVWALGILRGLISPASPRAARKAASVLWARRSLGIDAGDDECDALGLAVWTLRTSLAPTTLALALPEPRGGRRRRKAA
jgi:Holliday junction resolvasome RuvABC endonuclease subunit